jgi:UDP-N-acetylmuramoylalanine--D-glutamate ligase
MIIPADTGTAIVFGNGRSGRAAAETLSRIGFENVIVLDWDDSFPDLIPDVCVTSPGVPLDHPWHRTAGKAGVKVVSELQLGVERYRAAGGRLYAVTGSKGKSSVVKLVADGIGGIACGNYGVPVCEVFNRLKPGEIPQPAVVEVSSFQMETTELPPGTFEAAALLNLQEDHLDRHGTAAVYHALKLKLLDSSEIAVRGDDAGFAASPASLRAAELFAGSYFDNRILRANGLCAVSLMRAAGLNDAAIVSAFRRFRPLPHRMCETGEYDGVLWIDDSKATSIAALAAGVEMAAARADSRASRVGMSGGSRIFLIAGGLSKNDNADFAKECLQKWVQKVYLIGRCASNLFVAWRDVVQCEICGTLEKAVMAAKRDAGEGDCVLLSPGAASFDQFNSYGERGERFAELAEKGIKK